MGVFYLLILFSGNDKAPVVNRLHSLFFIKKIAVVFWANEHDEYSKKIIRMDAFFMIDWY